MNNMQKLGFWFKKHSPELLLALGITSCGASVVTACLATKKLDGVTKPCKKEIEQLHNEIADGVIDEKSGKVRIRREYVNTGMKILAIYSPAILTFGLGTGCIIGSHSIMKDRNMAIVAAFTTLKTGYDAYRVRVREKYGEEVERSLFEGNTPAAVTTNKKTNEPALVEEKPLNKKVDEDFSVLIDETSSVWNHDGHLTALQLIQIEEFANRKLVADGYLFLSDIYERLGISANSVGARKLYASRKLGWIYDPANKDIDSYISFGIQDRDGRYSQALKNLDEGLEKYIYLDFNVDGPIEDKFMEVAVKKG